ncbi:uncharacterized protein TM35_000062110 [Trypanosoma theileri]|uniref:Uncharacterized protein n=1 Tax=Trypanosoma theileri TaxID=67003 RepID=A0A1X0P2N5_9TRYP|nr:uncharacterized protein TM35_000062110 [Trypanosoma theileri]ORC91206.1 hypothetical protein TM35_000062110 [Trypanosoma theileri]
MPRKQWSKLRSDAVTAAHNPTADVSYPKSELVQKASRTSGERYKVAVNRGISRDDNTQEKEHSLQSQQQEPNQQQEDHQVSSDDVLSTRKRIRIEKSVDSTQDSSSSAKPSVVFTQVESLQLTPPVKVKHRTMDTTTNTIIPASKDNSPAPAVAGNDGPMKLDNNISRTEAEVLQQHGPLTQLNSIYLSHGESSHDSSITTEEDPAEEKVEEMEDRLRRRREELLQISPGKLALYTRLAECGIDAIDRPFVTCAVKRAQTVVAEWASSFM